MNSESRKFISSTSWQVVSQIYTMVLSLVVGVLTARYLGPGNYGLIGYGQSLVSIFTSVSTLGMSTVVVKDLVEKPERKSELLGTALVLRLISSTVSILLIDVLVLVIEPGNTILRYITLIQSVALVFQAFDTLSYWFLSRLENKFISIGSIVANTLVYAWRVILLIKGTPVIWFAASSCIQYLASGLVIGSIFVRKGNWRLSFSMDAAKSILSRSYHFIFSGIAIALYTQVDKVMLGNMLGETEVGYYTAATSVANMWEFVPLAIINSAKVLIFESRKRSEQEYKQRLSLLLAGITAMGIVVSLGFMVFGKLAIRILYGEAYMSAVGPLVILIWGTVFAVLGSARGSTWIIAENLNKYSKNYVFISSAVNIALNWLTIPVFGIMGAAVATLVAQIVNVFIAPIFFKKTRSFIRIYLEAWPISVRYVKNLIQNRCRSK